MNSCWISFSRAHLSPSHIYLSASVPWFCLRHILLPDLQTPKYLAISSLTPHLHPVAWFSLILHLMAVTTFPNVHIPPFLPCPSLMHMGLCFNSIPLSLCFPPSLTVRCGLAKVLWVRLYFPKMAYNSISLPTWSPTMWYWCSPPQDVGSRPSPLNLDRSLTCI